MRYLLHEFQKLLWYGLHREIPALRSISGVTALSGTERILWDMRHGNWALPFCKELFDFRPICRPVVFFATIGTHVSWKVFNESHEFASFVIFLCCYPLRTCRSNFAKDTLHDGLLPV